MKLIKLDGRYSGVRHWQYAVEFYGDMAKMFEVRNWCWEIWGASCEREYWTKDPNPNQHWSWQCDKYGKRIYFKTDAEASMYLLRFT